MGQNHARLSAEIEFADGKVRTVRPLKISKLRKFIKVTEDIKAEDGQLNDQDIDKMIDAAAIIMEDIDPELANDREKLEEALDVELFWKLMAVSMGNRLSDPNTEAEA